jgi:hypothetical protein
MKICKKIKQSKEQIHKTFTQKRNNAFQKAFAKIPFEDRIVFVPHCLRKTQVCKAKEKGSFYTCVSCGGCKIAEIDKAAGELGYKKLYILKGGRSILKIIEEDKPKGILGAACFFEGYQAFKMLENFKIAVQFVNLTKDGCVDTDLDLTEIKKRLALSA